MPLFGFAKVDITPKTPQFLAGYAGRVNKHCGISDPIYVRASAIKDDNGVKLLLVSFDLLHVNESVADEIYNACQSKYALSRNFIQLNAIHTHCAPIIEEYFYAPEWIPDWSYRQLVVDAAIQAIGEALDDMSTATLRFGMGSYYFGINRRLKMENGDIGMCPNPDGYYMAEVPVLQAKRQGKEDTVLYSFACHPTSRGGDFISADYPGFAAAAFNGNLQFMQGAAGSAKVKILNADGTRFTSADDAWLKAKGKEIAAWLNDFIASDKMREITPELKAQSMRVDLPLDKAKVFTKADLDYFYKYNDGDNNPYVKNTYAYQEKELENDTWERSCPAEVHGIQLAKDIKFITVSAEITAELAKLMIDAAKAPQEQMFLLGYTGFRSDYLPTAQIIKEGGYEGYWAQHIHGYCAPFSAEIDAIMQRTARAVTTL